MKKVTRFAIPITAGALINMLSSFAAMLMVAQLGQTELAAGALAIPTFITFLTVFGTIFYAIGILVSHQRGQEQASTHIGQLVKNGLYLALLLTIPAGLLLWHIDKLLLAFHQPIDLIHIARPYFHYAAWVMLPTLLFSVISQFYMGIGKPKFTMAVASISLPLIILVSYVLILGKLGLPQMGLAGISCAALIVQSSMCFALFIYIYINKNLKQYAIFSGSFIPNIRLCKSIFTLGLPIGIQFGAELAAMTVATYMMGYFGVIPLAASQIVSQYAMFVVMIILGLSQALSVLISEAYAQKNMSLIKQYIISGKLILSLVFIGIFTAFLFLPHWLMQPYINIHDPMNAELIHLTNIFFVLAGIMLFFDGMRNLFSGELRGLHDSHSPMRIGVMCMWLVSLPASYIIGFTLHGGPIGLRLGFLTGFIVACGFLWARIFKNLSPSHALSPRINTLPAQQTK